MKFRFSLVLGTCVLALAACTPSNVPENSPEDVDSSASSAVMVEPEDGVTMKGGVMLVVADGQMSRMEKDIEYKDGTTVKVDGMVTLADGTQLMLPEGMMVTTKGQLRMSAAAPAPASKAAAASAASAQRIVMP